MSVVVSTVMLVVLPVGVISMSGLVSSVIMRMLIFDMREGGIPWRGVCRSALGCLSVCNICGSFLCTFCKCMCVCEGQRVRIRSTFSVVGSHATVVYNGLGLVLGEEGPSIELVCVVRLFA